jgi:uncharacterized membrane protein
MNLHPLVVHFPIALLSLYVLFEVLPLERWYPSVRWQDSKAILVAVGGIGLLAALVTGQMAEHSLLALSAGPILRFHKMFADASAAVFGIIAAAYVIRWILERHGHFLRRAGLPIRSLRAIATVLLDRRTVVSLAIIGFIVLFLAGIFGEMIVYGPQNDLFSRLVTAWFFPSGIPR